VEPLTQHNSNPRHLLLVYGVEGGGELFFVWVDDNLLWWNQVSDRKEMVVKGGGGAESRRTLLGVQSCPVTTVTHTNKHVTLFRYIVAQY
jgi:hypothetical protein